MPVVPTSLSSGLATMVASLPLSRSKVKPWYQQEMVLLLKHIGFSDRRTPRCRHWSLRANTLPSTRRRTIGMPQIWMPSTWSSASSWLNSAGYQWLMKPQAASL
ncbi:hypothetical protein D3C80_1831730 [compost metagenome]